MSLKHLPFSRGLVASMACLPLSAADGLKRLTPPGPAAQQFLAEVSRILEEGTARQETNQEMTGKIAHAASVTHLSSLGSQGASGKHAKGPALPNGLAMGQEGQRVQLFIAQLSKQQQASINRQFFIICGLQREL